MAVVATYTYDPSSAEGRKGILDEHLAFIQGLDDSGVLLAVGRLDGADFDILFLLDVESPAEAERLLAGDPYRHADYISAVRTYEWSPRRGRLTPLGSTARGETTSG